ncbi:MAG: hydrogenase maturation protease [Firmicutes bacterium]|nr:hydrogenase maturation protease [Bacillota bacterium]
MPLIPQSTRKKTTVVGVGDPLLGDRGVGILIAEALADHNLPPHVQVVDARSAGDSLDSLFANSDKVILIDTADTPGEPGTIYRITPANPHDPAWASRLNYASTTGVFAAWEDALKSGASPSLTIIAIKPEVIRPAAGLSKKAASAVPKVVQAVMAEVASELDSDT